MIVNHSNYLDELNKERAKEGLPALGRRQFCKLAATSSAFLVGMSGLFGCEESNQQSGCGQSGGEAAGCGGPSQEGNGGDDYVKIRPGMDTRGEFKIIPGVELDDYSGPWRPELRFTDFSKVGLSRLHQMASEYHNAIMAAYRGYQYKEHGHEIAKTAEENIWGRNQINQTYNQISELMKINGRNLEAFMKQWQVELNSLPSVNSDVVFEMPSKRRALVTINRCPLAIQYETEGRTDELREVCMARCPKAIQGGAQKYNGNIMVKNITMPPRQSENHVCCKWELYYKADGSKSAEESDILMDKMDERGKLEARRGVDLKDYSGAFRPDLRITDFSRELLARMYIMYHQLDLNMIMGYQVFEMNHSEGGGGCDYAAGTKMQLVVWSYDLAVAARTIQMKYLNTPGNGIDGFLKALQVDITAQQPNFDCTFEMPDENTGIYTFQKCFGITMMEKTGGTEEQIKDTCALDPPAIGNSCDMYSEGLSGKKINLDIITMPPRKYSDEVCCQWKFTYVPA